MEVIHCQLGQDTLRTKRKNCPRVKVLCMYKALSKIFVEECIALRAQETPVYRRLKAYNYYHYPETY